MRAAISNPFKALLVEGTSGIGKSTLIDALIRRHTAEADSRRIRTLLYLAQSHTYGPLAHGEDARTLTVEENQGLLARILDTLEWLHADVQEHVKPSCFVIIDALHLTHCVRPGVAQWDDVAEFDNRLAAIGCKLAFLRVQPTAIWDRGIKPRADQEFIRHYAQKFGSSEEDIHRYFVGEQEILADLFSRSAMPKMLIQADCPLENYLDAVYTFWKGSSSDGAELTPC